jgi:hypothetical protein
VIEALVVGELYSNEEIFKSLKVSNAGGIRLSLQDQAVQRATIMTSVQDFHGSSEVFDLKPTSRMASFVVKSGNGHHPGTP